jgi:hypothetical protein
MGSVYHEVDVFFAEVLRASQHELSVVGGCGLGRVTEIYWKQDISRNY